MRPRVSEEIKNRAKESRRLLLAEAATAEEIKRQAVSTEAERAEINKRTLMGIVTLATELGPLGSDNIDPTAFDVFLGATRQKKHWLDPTETKFSRDGRQGWVVAQRIAYLAPKHPLDKSDNLNYLVKNVALMNDGSLITFPSGKQMKYDLPGYIERLDRQRIVEHKPKVERLMISLDGSIRNGNTFLLNGATTIEDAANRMGEAGMQELENGLVSFIAQHDLTDKL